MGESLNDAVSWVASQSLAEDGKGNTKTEGAKQSPSLSFPSEFPYEFDSLDTTLSSPVDSVLDSSSTETNTDNNNSSSSDEEEDFLAELTRRLTHSRQQIPVEVQKQKNSTRIVSGSPESTLSGIGSWSVSSNGSSPPATPFGCQDDTWDLISAAAGQVARLKMSNEAINNKNCQEEQESVLGPHKSSQNPVHVQNFGLFTRQSQYQQYLNQEQHMVKAQCTSIRARQQVRTTWSIHQHEYHQQHIQSKARTIGYENVRCGGGGRPLGLPQSAWPSLQLHHHHHHQQRVPQHHANTNSSGMRAVFLGGSGSSNSGGVKRERSGTGVFLPRRFGNNNPTESRKKSGCSTALLPAKVVQALNLNFEDMNGHIQHQQRFDTNFYPNYDALMARRNALLALQKRSLRPESAINHEIQLPQEWTY